MKPARVLRGAGAVLAVLLATLLLYWAVDEAAWSLLRHLDRGKVGYLESFPAYRLEAAASPAFERELSREPGGWELIPGAELLEPAEFHGRFFNVDRLPPTGLAYRRTLDPPAAGRPVSTVLLLGGSAVYGPMVPDGSTLASALAARLDKLDRDRAYRIYNAGVIGAASAQERDRLAVEIERGLKPDIVISFDGDIDATSGVYYGDVNRSETLVAERSGANSFAHRVLPTHIYDFLRSWAIERRARNKELKAPAHLADPAAMERLAGKTRAAFLERHRAMAELAKSAGARYIAVLGPNPYSPRFDHPGADIADVRRRAEARYPGLPEAVAYAGPALSQAMRDLGADGIESIDLSDALAGKTEDIYYDMGHYNSAGYRLLAAPIAAAILSGPRAPAP